MKRMIGDKKVLFSGMQATGTLTLGNYLGALKNWVTLSDEYECFYSVVDMHSITVRQDPATLRKRARALLTLYIAAGLDPEKNCIYYQSHVSGHAELMWILNCFTYMGELNRMTQFKDKAAKHADNINAGLFTYPVLMAADILLYQADVVPVGKDQLPHLEMTRTIARRFNEKFCKNCEPIFPMPQALLSKTPSIMGLDGNQKMSKSRGNAIMLCATEDETAKLIKKAKTDAERFITYDPVNRPEVANLLQLISLCTDEEPGDIAQRIASGGGGMLKNELTQALNEKLRPLRQKRLQLEKEPAYIQDVLKNGVKKAREIAEQTLCEVRKAMNMEI